MCCLGRRSFGVLAPGHEETSRARVCGSSHAGGGHDDRGGSVPLPRSLLWQEQRRRIWARRYRELGWRGGGGAFRRRRESLFIGRRIGCVYPSQVDPRRACCLRVCGCRALPGLPSPLTLRRYPFTPFSIPSPPFDPFTRFPPSRPFTHTSPPPPLDRAATTCPAESLARTVDILSGSETVLAVYQRTEGVESQSKRVLLTPETQDLWGECKSCESVFSRDGILMAPSAVLVPLLRYAAGEVKRRLNNYTSTTLSPGTFPLNPLLAYNNYSVILTVLYMFCYYALL